MYIVKIPIGDCPFRVGIYCFQFKTKLKYINIWRKSCTSWPSIGFIKELQMIGTFIYRPFKHIASDTKLD